MGIIKVTRTSNDIDEGYTWSITFYTNEGRNQLFIANSSLLYPQFYYSDEAVQRLLGSQSEIIVNRIQEGK